MSNLINPYRFAAGGLPTSFDWNPEIDGAGTLPGGATFTRASDAQEFTGSTFVLRTTGVIRDQSVAEAGGDPGYLGEPATTNQMITNDLSDSAWGKTGLEVPVPDLGVNAIGLNEYELDAETGDSVHRAVDGPQVSTTGNAYVIAKQSNHEFTTVVSGFGGNDYAAYDLDLGTITETGAGVDSSSINDFSNGYFRCGIISSDASPFFMTTIVEDGTPGTASPSFTGADQTILICHEQYTSDNFYTSPIVTSGSTKARAADVIDSGVVIPEEFGALFDFTAPEIIGTSNTISLLGADTSVVDILRLDASFNVIMDDGGTPTTIGTVSGNQRFKISYGRDATGRSASLDGATAVTGNAPSAAHEGENFEVYSTAGANQARGIGHLSTIYSVRPSDAELETLSL